MTKRQELEVLADAIAKLGPDSYLGPWLASVSGEVESYIRSDYFPSCDLKSAVADCVFHRQEAKRVLDAAHASAAQIIEAAHASAAQIIEAAHASAAQIIEAGHKTVRANNEVAKLDLNKAIEGAIIALRERQYYV